MPSSRATPKQTAAQHKSIIANLVSDDDDDDSAAEKKKSGSRGRPRKGSIAKSKAGKRISKSNQESDDSDNINNSNENGKANQFFVDSDDDEMVLLFS